jgi:hypothetical protein
MGQVNVNKATLALNVKPAIIKVRTKKIPIDVTLRMGVKSVVEKIARYFIFWVLV